MLTEENRESISSAARKAWDRLSCNSPARAEVLELAAGSAAAALAAEFFAAMNTYNTPAAQVRVVLDGVRVPPHHYSTNRHLKIAHFDVVDRVVLNRYFDQGATVMLDDAQTAIPALDGICTELTAYSGVPTAGTVFASPPHAEGFALHQDAEDVIIVQLAGSKTWSVFPPLTRRMSSMLKESECGEPVIETELKAGDVMVLPKGSPHKTASNSSAGSVHLTIGCYPVTLRDVLARLIDRSTDPRLDEAVPDDSETLADSLRLWAASELDAGVLADASESLAIADGLRTRLRGDAVDFLPVVADSPVSGGSYRVLRRVSEMTKLFLAAQLGRRDDSRLDALVAGLQGKEPGDTFTYSQFAEAHDRIVAQEVLHEMLRMRFVGHVWAAEDSK